MYQNQLYFYILYMNNQKVKYIYIYIYKKTIYMASKTMGFLRKMFICALIHLNTEEPKK